MNIPQFQQEQLKSEGKMAVSRQFSNLERLLKVEVITFYPCLTIPVV